MQSPRWGCHSRAIALKSIIHGSLSQQTQTYSILRRCGMPSRPPSPGQLRHRRHIIVVAGSWRFWSNRRCVSHAFHVQGSQGGTLPPNIPLDMGGLMSGHMPVHLLRHLDPVLSGDLAGNPDEVLYGYLDPHLSPVRCGNPDRVLSRIPVPYPVGVLVGIISPVEGPHQGRHLPRHQGGIQGGLEVSTARRTGHLTTKTPRLVLSGVEGTPSGQNRFLSSSS